MRILRHIGGVRRLCDTWVHAKAAHDPVRRDEHAHFLATHLSTGAVSLLSLPVMLALPQGSPGVFLAGLIGAGALGLATFVSRTGRLTLARFASLAGVTAMMTAGLSFHGGASLAGSALYLVPLAASLAAGSAALTSFGAVAAATGWGTLHGGLIPASGVVPPAILAALCVAIALLATALRTGAVRRRMETDRQNARRQVDTVVDSVAELVTRHDAGGRTGFVSPAARSLFGRPARDLLGTGYVDCVHLQDRVAFLNAISQTAYTRRDHACRVRVRTAGEGLGGWRHLDLAMRSAPADGTKGAEPDVIVVARCAQEDVARDERLRDLEEQVAREAETRNRFLATMGHELRTPLNAIIGFSEVLEAELIAPLPDERQREHVRLIGESGNHLLNVVNDVLDASRLEAGRYELDVSSFCLKREIEAVVAMLGPMADEAAVRVRTHVQRDLPLLTADRRACRQILINLVSNAIKFTKAQGEVRIEALRHGRNVRLRVRDTGIGIPGDQIERLGEPFYQVDSGHDRRFAGSGLGLSVVQGLVDLHEGELRISSREGAGTHVTLTLPLKPRTDRPRPAEGQDVLVRLPHAREAKTAAADEVQELQDEGVSHARVSA